MYTKQIIFSCLSAAAILLFSSSTQASDLGLSVRAGSLGAGVELDYAMTDKWSLRLQAHDYSKDDDFEEDGIDYSAELDLSSYGLVLDWHPFGGSFRLSAGAYSNSNEVDATSLSADSFEVGDTTYISIDDDPIQLEGNIALGDGGVAPYLGFGWGNSPENDGGFMFSLDIGVMQSGEAEVNLVGSGSAYDSNFPQVPENRVDFATNAQAQEEIAKEEQELREEFEDYEFYPVLMLGIGYRF